MLRYHKVGSVASRALMGMPAKSKKAVMRQLGGIPLSYDHQSQQKKRRRIQRMRTARR